MEVEVEVGGLLRLHVSAVPGHSWSSLPATMDRERRVRKRGSFSI